MSSPSTFEIFTAIVAAIFWIVMLYLWVSFMSEVKQRLRVLEKIAAQQAELLDRISLNTMPPDSRAQIEAQRAANAATKKRAEVERFAANELANQRESWVLGTIVLIAIIAVIVLYFVAPH